MKHRDVQTIVEQIIAEKLPPSNISLHIIKITDIASKINRNIHKNKDELLKQIQTWYEALPMNTDRAHKIITVGERIYFASPSKHWRNYYGNFDEKRQSGCLLTVRSRL